MTSSEDDKLRQLLNDAAELSTPRQPGPNLAHQLHHTRRRRQVRQGVAVTLVTVGVLSGGWYGVQELGAHRAHVDVATDKRPGNQKQPAPTVAETDRFSYQDPAMTGLMLAADRSLILNAENFLARQCMAKAGFGKIEEYNSYDLSPVVEVQNGVLVKVKGYNPELLEADLSGKGKLSPGHRALYGDVNDPFDGCEGQAYVQLLGSKENADEYLANENALDAIVSPRAPVAEIQAAAKQHPKLFAIRDKYRDQMIAVAKKTPVK